MIVFPSLVNISGIYQSQQRKTQTVISKSATDPEKNTGREREKTLMIGGKGASQVHVQLEVGEDGEGQQERSSDIIITFSLFQKKIRFFFLLSGRDR